MSSAEPPILIDARLRAMLLWEEPWLWSQDGGAEQWLQVLRLEFPRVGMLEHEDALSLAAHLARAGMLDDAATARSLRAQLEAIGDTGRLLAGLISLWLDLEDRDRTAGTLEEVRQLIDRVEDEDVRARLLLRLSAFARRAAMPDTARDALVAMITVTDTSTRLGVVARRAAAAQGIEVPEFNPWSATDTPEDQLLSLPWVLSNALEAAAALSAERLEHELRGVWDSSFHVGRTKLDDLLAALAQAEWCGSVELQRTIAQLASSHMLLAGNEPPPRTRWALKAWATSGPGKQVAAAVNASEDKIDAAGAATLLREVREEGLSDERAFLGVAAAVWDLLDDDGASELLQVLVASLPAPQTPQIGGLIANLLWRSPGDWAAAFAAADGSVRSAMLEPLDPQHVDAMPARLRDSVIAHRREHSEEGPLDAALAIVTDERLVGEPKLSPPAALELLSWRRDALPAEAIAKLVDAVAGEVRATLQKAAEGAWDMGDGQTHLLGDLASYLPSRREDVIDLLLEVCRSEHAAAAWQFGALEALMLLRHAGHLDQQDLHRVRGLDIAPGRALFGEDIGASLLHAAQLRVLADSLFGEDIAWLATCARGPDAQCRLVAIAALADIGNLGIPAVQWTLVSGMFDPSDEVAARAINGYTLAEGASSDANAVVRARLVALYESATRRLRQQVVVAAKRCRELELQELLAAAASDRAWTVRREAADGL
jgi:hypothetical protein